MKVRKAVIPAAGLGTRLSPVTKSIPKEMLPIITKPMIQFIVEEAVESGIEEIYIIINHHKEAIRKYLLNWHYRTEAGGMRRLRDIVGSCKINFLFQDEPLGCGGAILMTREWIGSEPFAILMPDNISFYKGKPPLGELMTVFEERRKDTIGLVRLSPKEARTFGNVGRIDGAKKAGLFSIRGLHNKGQGNFRARGNKPVIRAVGKAVALPHFFTYLERVQETAASGEVDDVPAWQLLIKENEVLGVLLKNRIFDVGNPLGYAAALQFASRFHLRK